MQQLQEKYGSELQSNLLVCKDKNALINKQLLRTFAKFERLLQYESKAAASGLAGNVAASTMVDTQRRDRLLAVQAALQNKI